MTRSLRNCLGFATGLIAISILAVSMGACSLLTKLTSPAAAPVVDAAVLVAVATAEAKGVTAAQINSVAKQALAADTGVTGTLAAVSTLVNVQIAKLSLPAADMAAIQIVEVALEAEITAKIGANANLATAQAAVAEVLNDVIAVTGG